MLHVIFLLTDQIRARTRVPPPDNCTPRSIDRGSRTILLEEEFVTRLKVWLQLLLASTLLASPLLAQRRIVGRVTDQANGQPVPGASVQVQGTRLGTYATDSGTFTVLTPDGPATLVVRHIGYQRREIPVPAGDSGLGVLLRSEEHTAELQ